MTEVEPDADGGDAPDRSGGAFWIVPAVGLAVVIAGVLALLDRRLMSADRRAMEAELQSLNARLEKSADVVPLRLELEEKGRDVASLASSVTDAQRAIGSWPCDAVERLPLRGTLPSTGSGFLSLPREGGTGLLVATGLRAVQGDGEYVLAATIRGEERELARFRPDRRGVAIVAFDAREPSSSVTGAWLKIAPAGRPPAGVPLLFHSRTSP